MAKMGTWLMPLGIILALAGIFFASEWVSFLIIVAGMLIGFLNYDKAETQKGLLFIIALGVTGGAFISIAGPESLTQFTGFVENFFANLGMLFGSMAGAMTLVAGYRIGKK